MTNIEVTLSVEYGIMFLHDSKVDPIFPADAGENSVAHTSTCLAFSVLVYVDGDAKIILSNNNANSLNREYFNGNIECPSKSLSLFDTNGFAFASVPLTETFARISLRMSEDRNPDVVECVIENIESF